MGYKEKYQNALERAKKGLPIDEVFPELKESEDERINTSIKKALEFACAQNLIKYDDLEKMRDYLEKQKEAQPGDEDRYMEGYMNGINDALKRAEPTEWSEEDEKILDELLDHCNTENATWYKWLKSLRPQPHWKPREEQISALEYFIRSWGESGTMSPQNTILCAAKSLLNDLKKL